MGAGKYLAGQTWSKESIMDDEYEAAGNCSDHIEMSDYLGSKDRGIAVRDDQVLSVLNDSGEVCIEREQWDCTTAFSDQSMNMY
jgi:hypothetical protein